MGDREMKITMDKKDYIALMERTLALFGGKDILQYVWTNEMIARFAPNRGWAAMDLENIPAIPEIGHGAAAVNELKLYQLRVAVLTPKHEARNTLSILLIDSMNDTIKEKVTAQDLSIGNVPVRNMFTRLEVLFATMKPDRKKACQEALKEKLKTDEGIEEFFTKKIGIFKELRNGNHPYDARRQFETVFEAYCNEEGVFLRHAHVQGMFTQNFPTDDVKTLENLRTMLVRAEEAEPAKKVAGELFAGAASTGKEDTRRLTREEWKKIEQEENEKEKSNNRRGGEIRRSRGRSGGGRSEGRGDQGGGRVQGKSERKYGAEREEHGEFKCFCSTHGYNHTHNSMSCRFKSRDHKDDETPAERSLRLASDHRNNKYY
jgi:hypothetical protein